MSDKIREMLAFEDLTQEEKEKRGILGRLYGPCASISIPTRNGRGYNEHLWEKVLENDLFKEMFENGGLPLEMDHPVDREETDSSRIAAMMPEPFKKDKEGKLITYVDLIDTPMGRIAYQLAKYGFKLGISSRGSGDIIYDDDGNEIVDPDTYNFTTFDLVLLPAVKEARLTMTESLDSNVVNLKKALTEDLKTGKKLDGTEYTSDEKKMMSDALKDLGIDINTPDSTSLIKENLDTNSTETVKNTEEVTNSVSDDMLNSLKESLKVNAELELKIKSLQEQLAVSDTKVSSLEESISKSNDTIVRLTSMIKNSKTLKEENSKLVEELKLKDEKINTLLKRKSVNEELKSLKLLKEELTTKNKTISSNEEKIKKLSESLTQLTSANKEITSLKESLISLQENFKKKTEEQEKIITSLKENLSQSKTEIENYKNKANSIARYYIKTKAKLIGVDVNEIMNKLSESYSLSEVDKICEDLKRYKISRNKLPLDIAKSDVIKIRESKNISMSECDVTSSDDYISEDIQSYVDRL